MRDIPVVDLASASMVSVLLCVLLSIDPPLNTKRTIERFNCFVNHNDKACQRRNDSQDIKCYTLLYQRKCRVPVVRWSFLTVSFLLLKTHISNTRNVLRVWSRIKNCKTKNNFPGSNIYNWIHRKKEVHFNFIERSI